MFCSFWDINWKTIKLVLKVLLNNNYIFSDDKISKDTKKVLETYEKASDCPPHFTANLENKVSKKI